MKKQAIIFEKSKLFKTQKLFWFIVFLTCFIDHSSAQPTHLIGVEYGGMLIPKISSSGVNNSNYSLAIMSETQLNEHWSIGYGFKYLKYGSHVYYKPMWGILQGVEETLVQQQQYSIHNVGVCLLGKFRIKTAALFVGIQPEKALFNQVIMTQRVMPVEDIKNIDNFPQKQLRTFNLSLLGGIEFNRKFGDRLEFFTKPAAQYFLKSFYKNEGFNDTRFAFHLTFGLNYVLTVFADE